MVRFLVWNWGDYLMLANRLLPQSIDSYTKSLLHFEGAGSLVTTDETGKVWTRNGGTVPIRDITTFKFGLGSIVFNGTNWIDTPDSTDFTFGTGSWTIDCWIMRTVAGASRICGQSDSTSTSASISMALGFNNNNNFILTIGTTPYTGTAILSTLNTWIHVAAVKNGTSVSTYINGTLDASGTYASALPDSSNKFSIGRRGEDTASGFNGNIDEFRLSVGIARWTANFTPPTVPYLP